MTEPSDDDVATPAVSRASELYPAADPVDATDRFFAEVNAAFADDLDDAPD